MPNFNEIADTLYVPMLGRIYASEQMPQLLYDRKALELKSKLPSHIKGQDTQTQYTLLACAVRSTNTDRYIRHFMKQHPNGIIAQMGCGLETTYYRDDNGVSQWYEIDLPDVIAYRQELLGKGARETLIPGDGFSENWIRQIRSEHPNNPILVTASGLFYYFDRKKVFSFLQSLKSYGPIEVVFDTVNGLGIKLISHYMRQIGHGETPVYFYVGNARKTAQQLGVELLNEEPYYAHTKTHGLQFSTRATMWAADFFHVVKMIHFRLS